MGKSFVDGGVHCHDGVETPSSNFLPTEFRLRDPDRNPVNTKESPDKDAFKQCTHYTHLIKINRATGQAAPLF